MTARQPGVPVGADDSLGQNDWNESGRRLSVPDSRERVASGGCQQIPSLDVVSGLGGFAIRVRKVSGARSESATADGERGRRR